MNRSKKNKRLFNPLTYIVLIVASGLISSCRCNRDEKDFSRNVDQDKLDSIDITVKINRYEKDLFAIPIDSLKEGLMAIQSKYPFAYSPEYLDDPANILEMKQYLKDASIKSLYNEVMKQYPSLSWLEAELADAFKRIKAFFPDWTVPKVYSYVSGGDIQLPVKYAEDNLIIALDLFLGAKYPVYAMWGLPQYITNRMTRNYIVLRSITEIGRAFLEKNNVPPKTLLDNMIFEGKLLYFTDVTITGPADSTRIGYSSQAMYWAEKNQGNVWGFFVEKKLLHTTEMKEINKFIGEAPFTSAFSNVSAPRIGRYIGWQIVRAYMSRNKNVSVEQLMKNKNAQEILNKSGYKPQKEE